MYFAEKLIGSAVFTLLFSILIVPNSALAQRISGDLDQDGLSDLVLITIDSKRGLNWHAVDPTGSRMRSLGKLGKAGEHIVLQDWLAEGRPQIGVVGVNKNNRIEWKILSQRVGRRSKVFGNGGQTVVSGADFNKSGFGDAVVVSVKGRRLEWQIFSDFFRQGSSRIRRFAFGLRGDKTFYANVDGSGDWMAVSRRIRNNVGRIIFRNPRSGRKRVQNVRGRIANLLRKQTPFALQQPDGRDMLVVARRSGNRTTMFFQPIGRGKVVRKIFNGKGDVVTGNFINQPGYEVLLQQAGGRYLIYNRFADSQKTIQAPAGVLVDETNINRLRGIKGVSDDTSPATPGNTRCEKFPGSFIYKTIGSHHFSDIRRVTAGLILRSGSPGPYPSCIEVKDTRGNLIAKMGAYYPAGAGWAARYYAGWGCGTSTALSGSAIGSRARQNSGSTQIIFNFGSKCYGPIDATKCIGSSQC